MKTKSLSLFFLCLILISGGAGCDASDTQKMSAVEQEQVPPKVFDPKISPDGKKQVQVSGSTISISSETGTLSSSFVAPSLCGADIDKNVWFGQDGETILYYTYCGNSDESAIYRLNAKTGEVIKRYGTHAVQLDVNDATGRVATFVLTQKETGFIVANLRNTELHTVLQRNVLPNGMGSAFFVGNAFFSPNGSKLFFTYSDRTPGIEPASSTNPFQEFRAIYDISTQKTIDITKYFSFNDKEAFYGWIDNETFVTKNSSGKYHTHRLDR